MIANSPIGEIASPKDLLTPEVYPNDANCQWLITVDDAFVIRLTALEFEVEDG